METPSAAASSRSFVVKGRRDAHRLHRDVDCQYASAWPSRDIETAALQQQARDWWALERPKFDLVTSQLTLDEASAGDPTAAADRLKLLDGLALVEINADTEALAARLLAANAMPQKAAADALTRCMLPLRPWHV